MQSIFPININDIAGYKVWREEKLANLPASTAALMVDIADPYALSDSELTRIKQNCDRANMCFYRLRQPVADKGFITAMGEKLGLHHLDSNLCADNDSITSLETRDLGRKQGYIPYTPNRLNWHTDGYYNSEQSMVRGIIMHCVQTAAQGGENQFLDPDLMYIHLRDINPAWVNALMQDDAMSIPPNVEGGEEIRGTTTGPVFSLDKQVMRLHMRYTARTKSIEWKQDPLIDAALKEISAFLQSDSDWIIRYKLQPGEGIICNNVLHNRSAYEDDSEQGVKRLLYRARFFERVRLSEE